MDQLKFDDIYTLVNKDVKELEFIEDSIMNNIDTQFDIIKDILNDGESSVLSFRVRQRVNRINELYKVIDLIDNIINAKERN